MASSIPRFKLHSRNESGQADVPVTVEYQVESNFESIALVGVDLTMQATIYEDLAHNFEFSISMDGAINGDGPVDIDALPTTNDWESDRYWDSLDVNIVVDRRVFNLTNRFETHFVDDELRFDYDRINFTGYPGSVA
jgi:hypothetical protein